MNDIAKVLSSAFKFEDAIKIFGEKFPLTAKEFYSLQEEYKNKAFTVANYSNVKIIEEFQRVLLKAIEGGKTMQEFKSEMNNFLEEHGYKGLTNYRADVIFRTNIQTAYNVGHYKSMTAPSVKKLRPYWKYVAVDDGHTRPTHRAMNGKVFPADHPIWDTWYPPNGFRCRCQVVTLSKRQVEERGLTIEEEIPKVVEFQGIPFRLLPDRHFQNNPAKGLDTQVAISPLPETLQRAYLRKTKKSKK